MQRTEYDWNFKVESTTACKGLVNGCLWPRGKMLGGSSGINLMLYVRGFDRDFNRWNSEVKGGWGYEEVLPFFKKSESNQWNPFVEYSDGRYHSELGPLKVGFFGGPNDFAQIFYEAGMEQGIPYIKDINADKHHGFVTLQGTVYNGRRQSTAKAFLIPAKNRTNLHIIKHAFVTKILIDGDNRSYGVQFLLNGHTFEARANKEVILSAGSIMSPVLLMQSGVGPKKQLQKHMINCKANLPGVGSNLQDHVSVILFFEFQSTAPISPTSDLDNVYNFAVHSNGSWTSAGISQLVSFFNTTDYPSYPDIQTYYSWHTQNSPSLPKFIQMRRFKEEIAGILLEKTKDRNIAVVIVTLVQPKSRGEIRINGSSTNSEPIIEPNYFSDPDDMKTMIRALKQQISFVDTDSYRKNFVKLIRLPLVECDRFNYQSDKYFECYIKYLASTLFHPVGTCKMGTKPDPSAVVDSELKVHCVKGLRTIDASM